MTSLYVKDPYKDLGIFMLYDHYIDKLYDIIKNHIIFILNKVNINNIVIEIYTVILSSII